MRGIAESRCESAHDVGVRSRADGLARRSTPNAAQVLLDGGAPSKYRQTLRSDSRIPDPAWYHRTQKRPAVAAIIDAFNEELMKRRIEGWRQGHTNGLAEAAGNGCRHPLHSKVADSVEERFYDPDKGGFMRNIGAVRFAFYASEYVKDGNEEETASVAPTSLCDPNTVSNTVRIAQDTDRPETVVVEFAAGKGVAAVHAIRRQLERRKGRGAACETPKLKEHDSWKKASPDYVNPANESAVEASIHSGECQRLPPTALANLKLAELKSRVFEHLVQRQSVPPRLKLQID